MWEALLLVSVTAAFVVGWLAVGKMDAFLEENERLLQQTEETAGQSNLPAVLPEKQLPEVWKPESGRQVCSGKKSKESV